MCDTTAGHKEATEKNATPVMGVNLTQICQNVNKHKQHQQPKHRLQQAHSVSDILHLINAQTHKHIHTHTSEIHSNQSETLHQPPCSDTCAHTLLKNMSIRDRPPITYRQRKPMMQHTDTHTHQVLC